MFFWSFLLFFAFLSLKCCHFCALPNPQNGVDEQQQQQLTQQFTFCPIVAELALKMVDECVEEYRKMVEQRPHIKGISGRETLDEFKYLWATFHAILSQVMMRNTLKNYRQIANSCQRWSDQTTMSLFCDFGKSFVFVWRHFEELQRSTKMEPKFVREVNEMLRKMETAYQIGWEFAGRIAQLNLQSLTVDVRKALRQIKLGHQFDPVDKQWAHQMLAQFADSCKTFGNEVESNGWTNNSRKNIFKLATNALKNVALQPPSSSSNSSSSSSSSTNDVGNNQAEIEDTCAALYGTVYQMFGVASPPSPSRSFGCWPMRRKQRNNGTISKVVDECLDRMRAEYEAEVGKLVKNYLGPTRQLFLDRMAFARLAQSVSKAVEEMGGGTTTCTGAEAAQMRGGKREGEEKRGINRRRTPAGAAAAGEEGGRQRRRWA